MNPYASALGGRDPLEVIAKTTDALRSIIGSVGDEADRRPGPGKWSVREVICHLADTEIVFAFRLRQAKAEPHHVIQPFDQDAWAASYAAYDARAALAVFEVVREWNRTFIAALTAEDLAKPLSHPERGQMTFQTLVETMGGHDLNHLAQIERVRAALAA